MCFFFRQLSDAGTIAKRFKIIIEKSADLVLSNEFNAFSHPECSVITNDCPGIIQKAVWGLIPPRARTPDIQKYTLNARIESIVKKSSFKDCVENRCLVIADGFYEWKEEMVYGKRQKIKHLICTSDGMPFAFAGLYSFSNARFDNTNKKTFTILTTEANETVARIHSKNRMPVIVKPDDEEDWLNGSRYDRFAYPYSSDLIAVPLFDLNKANKKGGDPLPSLFN